VPGRWTHHRCPVLARLSLYRCDRLTARPCIVSTTKAAQGALSVVLRMRRRAACANPKTPQPSPARPAAGGAAAARAGRAYLQHAPRMLRVVCHHQRRRTAVARPHGAVAPPVHRVRGRGAAQRGHLRQVAQQPGRARACGGRAWVRAWMPTGRVLRCGGAAGEPVWLAQAGGRKRCSAERAQRRRASSSQGRSPRACCHASSRVGDRGHCTLLPCVTSGSATA